MKKQKINKKKRNLAVVGIIFDTNGKILLTKREDPKSLHDHGKWQFPGGGIRFGEHPTDAVIREIKEEVGIEIDLLRTHPLVHSQVFSELNVHTILLGFPAKYKSGIVDISKDPKTGDAKWFNYEEINFLSCLPKTKELIEESKQFLIHNS